MRALPSSKCCTAACKNPSVRAESVESVWKEEAKLERLSRHISLESSDLVPEDEAERLQVSCCFRDVTPCLQKYLQLNFTIFFQGEYLDLILMKLQLLQHPSYSL